MHPKTWLHKLLCALCVQRLSAGTDTMYIEVNMLLKFLTEIFVVQKSVYNLCAYKVWENFIKLQCIGITNNKKVS